MNYSNQQNYNNLINWLMNYCFDHDIGACLTNELPDDVGGKSYVIPADLVVINNRWHNELEIPFIFAHEIGHVLYGSAEYYHSACRGTELGESDANLGAIKLLLQYAQETDMHFDTYYNFADAFGIPKKHYYLIDAYLIAK
ncbi:MAG: ImmA/IrrE family metallo-endopeptidase [Lactobacillus johnsonii]|nr:ImmA/IrrE family metallo-endopeptidase [Lactobacillus johnsonii]MDY5351682.1 ImmA/IrrE family metallo-endopeptidase [Lactobacillus johnsonii]MDY5419639.1 ImmA/IrrE family metallo-endopeptidase [Lactobacillus johnsonii]